MPETLEKSAIDGSVAEYLSRIGFPLVFAQQIDAATTVERIAGSGDERLLGLLPLILTRLSALPGHPDRIDLAALPVAIQRRCLTVMSALGLHGTIRDALAAAHPRLSDHTSKQELQWIAQTRELQDIYRHQSTITALDKLKAAKELRYCHHLATIFPGKQRQVIVKKLNHEPLTKTEREYFSRVIRKKLVALADSDLHDLARKLVG